MKKLNNAFNKGEVLTRAQLKKVMGGAVEPSLGDSKCNGVCIAHGTTCPSVMAPNGNPFPPEICPPRYPKCCAYAIDPLVREL